MTKKILASFLAVTMIVSSSFAAFAANPSATVQALGNGGDNPNQIQYQGDVQTPTIKVTFEGAREKVIANPYGLAITGVDPIEMPSDYTGPDVYPTLVGDTITVKNLSNMKVALGITGKITLDDGANVKIATDEKSMASDTKNKNLYVQGLITDADDKAMLVKTGGKAVAPAVYTAKGVVFTEPVLPASADGAAVADGGEIKIVISGSTSFPENDVWASTDKFTVTTSFDIKGSTADPSAFAAE